MKYKIKEGLVWDEVEEKIVVLDSKNGKYFSLNKSAGEIWSYLKKGLDERDMVSKVLKKYESSQRKDIETDIKKLLETLLKEGLLTEIK